MALTLLKLCKNAEKKYGLKLIAGRDGIENMVRWVHMVEDIAVPDFLHGNELVFTTGIANYEDSWLLKFVSKLQVNNAAGLVINLGPYIQEQEIPPQLIIYCEQNKFPLFTIPWQTRVVDITYEFCRIIIGNEKAEQSLAEAFKNLILGAGNTGEYTDTLERAGFAKESLYRVALIKFKEEAEVVKPGFYFTNETKFITMFRLNSFAKAMFVWKNVLVLIYQNISPLMLEHMVEHLRAFTQEQANLQAYMGISDVVGDYQSVQTLYANAESALIISEQNDEVVTRYEEIGIYKLLLNVKNKELLDGYGMEIIGPLLKHDEEHGTDLCDTLKAYCEHNGAINEMAEIAGVHRNTMNYKIRKIKEILNRDFNYKTIMDLMIAFTILEMKA